MYECSKYKCFLIIESTWKLIAGVLFPRNRISFPLKRKYLTQRGYHLGKLSDIFILAIREIVLGNKTGQKGVNGEN